MQDVNDYPYIANMAPKETNRLSDYEPMAMGLGCLYFPGKAAQSSALEVEATISNSRYISAPILGCMRTLIEAGIAEDPTNEKSQAWTSLSGQKGTTQSGLGLILIV